MLWSTLAYPDGGYSGIHSQPVVQAGAEQQQLEHEDKDEQEGGDEKE